MPGQPARQVPRNIIGQFAELDKHYFTFAFCGAGWQQLATCGGLAIRRRCCKESALDMGFSSGGFQPQPEPTGF